MDLSHPLYGVLALTLLLLVVSQKRLGRVMWRLMTAGLPVLILGVFAVGLILPEAALEGPGRQALVAGVVLATGWFVTFVFQEDRAERDRDRTRTEVLLALRAEIGNFLEKHAETQAEIGFDARKALLRATLDDEADESAFQPFFFSEPMPIVFPVMVARLPHLEGVTVTAIVRFYAQLDDIIAMAQDLQNASFLSRPGANRLQSYENFIDMKVRAGELAKAANAALDRELGTLRETPGSLREPAHA